MGNEDTHLIHRYISDTNYYNILNNNDDRLYIFQKFNLINEQRWRKGTKLPNSLLATAEGMSAQSHYRIWQSTTGLDDAGMDLQAAQLRSRAEQEVRSTWILSWLEDWQLSLFVVLCAIVGTVLFAFLILLWLRKQMSREKNSEDGDQRGLVEEGSVARVEKLSKQKTDTCAIDTQWLHHASIKSQTISVHQAIQPVAETPKLSEVTSLTPTTPGSSAGTTIAASSSQRRREPIRVRAKGLLERRGSSASLTIELTPGSTASSTVATVSDSPPHVVTPTRECTAEEFLLSAGNVLSRAQLRKAVSDPASLHKEFWEVPLNLPEKVDVCGSGVKNRYCSVLPNPQSRVVLPSSSDDPLGSYINANYIRGYDGQDVRYIATQGPLSHTIADFWRMVWAERVPVVVMMTRLHEAAKAKCDAYFPLDKNSRIQAGPFTIGVNSIDNRDGYTIRDLELCYEDDRRYVQHYWYDSWPDHAVPQSADALVSLAAEVNTLPGPVVVHCSAGIGRTGCFIALATGMTQLLRDGNVDVLGILCQMRYDRGGMVQTAEQYEFVHRALYLFEQTLGGKVSTSGD